MSDPLIETTEETPEEIVLKQQAAKKVKRKVNEYRTISISATLISFTLLWILCSNVSVIEVLILSLPLLGTAIFGYLAAEDTLKEKSKGRTLLQVVLTFLIALGIGFATKSTSNQQSLKTRAERDSLQKTSDSTISRRVTDSVKKIYDGISTSFADQGLKLDSLTFAVSKFRDSAKTVIMNSQVKDPVITIYNQNISAVTETSESLTFKVGITCEEESAKEVKLFYIAEIDYNIGRDTYETEPINLERIPIGQTYATDIPLVARVGTVKTITFLFYGKCKGSYQNSKEIKIDPILYIYRMDTKWATRYTGQTKMNYIEKYKAKGYDL